MPMTSINGIDLHYRLEGDGPETVIGDHANEAGAGGPREAEP